MAFTAASLADGQLASSPAGIYTATGVKAIIKSVTLFNTDSSSRTIGVYITRSGGTRRQIAAIELAAGAGGNAVSSGGCIVLSSGDALEAEASAGSVVDFVVMGATE